MSPQTALQNYALTRDPDSFRVVVQRYESFVYAVCTRMLTSADAEDAVQDVFFKLMRHADQIQDDAAGWLHRCAVNTCRDILRRNKTRRRKESRQEVQQGEPQETSTALVLSEIDEALLELQDHDRSLLTRYYLNGETQVDIADDLGVNQSTAQRRIDAALGRLRMVLNKRGVVAAAAGIVVAMTAESTRAAVPPSVSKGLAKLALAAPPLATNAAKPAFLSNQSHSVIKLIATILAALGIGGGVTWFSIRWLAASPDGGSTIVIEDKPEQVFYAQQFDLAAAPNLPVLIRDVRDASSRSGFSVAGPATFLHPEGIGTAPETTLIVAVPIVGAPIVGGAVSDKTVVSLPRQTMISVKSLPGDDPYEVISRLETAAIKAGYQRNYQDRFVNLDPSEEAGFAFEVQLGIRPAD